MALFYQKVISLELSTGVPMLYIFKEGKFIRRGSPSAPTDVGVYAYTKVCLFLYVVFFQLWTYFFFSEHVDPDVD